MTFAEQVYAVVEKIPKGKVSTYRLVAHALGSRAYRAVGSALRRNPRAPHVPCHRVVASDLTLGGFNGQTQGLQLQRKQKLLESEGVVFEGQKVSHNCVWNPSQSK